MNNGAPSGCNWDAIGAQAGEEPNENAPDAPMASLWRMAWMGSEWDLNRI